MRCERRTGLSVESFSIEGIRGLTGINTDEPAGIRIADGRTSQTFSSYRCCLYMEWTERLKTYNEKYGFESDAKRYGFDFNPERLLIRNEALRQADRDLYDAYLREKFPVEAPLELEQFDLVLANLLRLNNYEAERFFRMKGVNLLRSDIWYQDEDAIFTALQVAEDDIVLLTEGMDTEKIENHVFPEQVLNRAFVWVDGTQLADFERVE